MMEYEQMSDFEMNTAVASALGVLYCKSEDAPCVCIEEGGDIVEKDYCNVPNDAFPVMLKNEIGFQTHKGQGNWTAFQHAKPVKSNCGADKNPLRAAMIVFLKMHECDITVIGEE